MKWFNPVFLFLISSLPLWSLDFSEKYRQTDNRGRGVLIINGELLSQERLRVLSAWDLMEVVQTLTGEEIPLSHFGNNDDLTQQWRLSVVSFTRQADASEAHHPEDLFDPGLVLWDPGFIQSKNEWGQWSIQIGTRRIVQSDLATLSPLEVQQAVQVLTGRTYTAEFVLENLEAFRAQLTIVPRDPSEPKSSH